MTDDLVEQFLKEKGISKKPVSKPVKIDGDETVARVVDDELSKLGWSPNARLSMLGDLGRENGWNRQTIFGGHSDPKNKAYNRGIISWQGDRRAKLDDYLKKQGVYGKRDDDELRGMVRFLDEEMKSSPEWQSIHQAVRNPNISTYDASENLRKYIKYVPEAPYNTPDSEFRVKNNRDWAEKARKLGLGGNVSKPAFDFDEFSAEVLGQKKPVKTNPVSPVSQPAEKSFNFNAFQSEILGGKVQPSPTVTGTQTIQSPNKPVQPSPTVPGQQTLQTPVVQPFPERLKFDSGEFTRLDETGKYKNADGDTFQVERTGQGYTAKPVGLTKRITLADADKTQLTRSDNQAGVKNAVRYTDEKTGNNYSVSVDAQGKTKITREAPAWASGTTQPKTKLDPVAKKEYDRARTQFGARDSEEFRQKFLQGFSEDDVQFSKKYFTETPEELARRQAAAQNRQSAVKNQPQATSKSGFAVDSPEENRAEIIPGKPSKFPTLQKTSNTSDFGDTYTGSSQATLKYKQRPTVDQLRRDFLRTTYGEIGVEADKAHFEKYGSHLIEPPEGADFEAYIDSGLKNGEYVLPFALDRNAKMDAAVKGFAAGGSEGMDKAIGSAGADVYAGLREQQIRNEFEKPDISDAGINESGQLVFKADENQSRRVTEAELRESLVNPSFSDKAQEVIEKSLFTPQVSNFYDLLFGERPKQFNSEEELNAEVSKRADIIRREFGSFNEYQRAQDYARKMPFVEASARRFGGLVRGVVNTAISSQLKGLDVIDSLFEKAIVINRFLPEDKRFAPVRGVSNLLGYTIASLLGKGDQFEMATSATPVDKRLFYGIGERIEKALGDDKYLRQEFGYKLAQAAGSGIGFMALGFLAPEAQIATRFGNLSAVSGVAGTLSETGSLYDEAKRAGATENQALFAGAIGIPLGASEMFGLGSSLNRALDQTGQKLFIRELTHFLKEKGKDIAREMGEEAIQEFFQSTGGRVVLDYIQDKDPSEFQRIKSAISRLTKQAAETAVNEVPVAALTGGLLGGGTSLAVGGENVEEDENQQNLVDGIPRDIVSEILPVEHTAKTIAETPKRANTENNNEILPLAAGQKVLVKNIGERVVQKVEGDKVLIADADGNRVRQVRKNQIEQIIEDAPANEAEISEQSAPGIESDVLPSENGRAIEIENTNDLQAGSEIQSEKQAFPSPSEPRPIKDISTVKPISDVPINRSRNPQRKTSPAENSAPVKAEKPPAPKTEVPNIAEETGKISKQFKTRRSEVEAKRQSEISGLKPSSKITAKKPSKIDFYLSIPNQDGTFNEKSIRTQYKEGAHVYAFERIGNSNRFNVYIDERPTSKQLAKMFPEKTISPVFDSPRLISVARTEDVTTIEPSVYELQGDKLVPVERGKIDYDGEWQQILNSDSGNENKIKEINARYDSEIEKLNREERDAVKTRQTELGKSSQPSPAQTAETTVSEPKAAQIKREAPETENKPKTWVDVADEFGDAISRYDEEAAKIIVGEAAKTLSPSDFHKAFRTKGNLSKAVKEIEKAISPLIENQKSFSPEAVQAKRAESEFNHIIESLAGYKPSAEFSLTAGLPVIDAYEKSDETVEGQYHRKVVERAVELGKKIGKSVPPEVLADYPDLAQKYAPEKSLPENDSILKQVSPSVSPDPLGFFSQVEKTIDEKMPARASAQQIRGILSPNNGVKAEELAWLGIDEFLNSKDSFSKEEVLGFVRENNVKVEEVVKGDEKNRVVTLSQIEKKFPDEISQLSNDGIELFEYNDVSDGIPIGLDYNDSTYTPQEFANRYPRLAEPLRPILDFINNYKESDSENTTKFSQYTLPGGANYRELLLTMPPKDPKIQIVETGWKGTYKLVDESGNDVEKTKDGMTRLHDDWGSADRELRRRASRDSFKSGHFDEPNILAHVRFDERTDADGRRTLHIAEIQSDWHQAGRKKGYADSKKPFVVFDTKTGEEIARFATGAEARDKTAENVFEWDYDNELKSVSPENQKVPDAPFKKSWHELAFKRILRYAAENNFDAISWDTGEIQNDRYDLSKAVDEIRWRKVASDAYKIETIKDGIDIITATRSTEIVKSEKLGDMFGKEIAQQIINSNERSGKIEGDNLKVGGEGMKGFYDKILLSFVNRYVKKFGSKVETAEIGEIEHRVEMRRGSWVAILDDGNVASGFASEQEAREFLENSVTDAKHKVSVHAVAITDAMRDSVLAGQSLFKRRDGSTPGNYVEILSKASIEDITANTVSEFKGENLELNEYAAEAIRRLLAEDYFLQHGVEVHEKAFEGIVIEQSKIKRLAELGRELSGDLIKDGMPESELDRFDNLLKNLETLANKPEKYAVLYVFDDALAEEEFHREDLSAGRTDREALRELKQSPFWKHTGKKFNSDYPNLSDADKASEIAAKLATDQAANYGWDRVENFEEEKTRFLNAWADGVLRRNESVIKSEGIEKFLEKYQRIAKYGNLETFNQRRNAETRGSGRSDAPSSSESQASENRSESESETDESERNRDGRAASGLSEIDRQSEIEEEAQALQTSPAHVNFKNRQYAATLRENGRDAQDVPYIPESEAEWIEEAKKILADSRALADETGAGDYDRAISQFESKDIKPGVKTALGIALIDHLGSVGDYAKMSEVAELTVNHVGEAAQALRASQLVSKYDFEKGVTLVQKSLADRGKTLSQNDIEKIRDLTKKYATSEEQRAIVESALKEAEETINQIKAENDEITEALGEAKTVISDNRQYISNLKKQLTRWKNKALGLSQSGSKRSKTHKELADKRQVILDRLKTRFPETSVVLKSVSDSELTKKDFLGKPKITTNANARFLRPIAITSLDNVEAEPFMDGQYTAKFSEDGAAVFDGENVIASYNFGSELVVDKKYRRRGIATELVYQWRTRYPAPAVATTRTKISQAIQKKVLERIVDEGIIPLKAVTSETFDDETRQTLTEYTALQIFDSVPYREVIKNLQDLTQDVLTDAEIKSIHADAVMMTRGEKADLSTDVLNRLKVRGEHNAEAKKVLAHKNPNLNRFEREILNLAGKDEALGAAGVLMNQAKNKDEWFQNIEKLNPDLSNKEKDALFRKAFDLKQKAKQSLEKLREENKRDAKLTEKEFEQVRQSALLARAAAREQKKTLDSYYNQLTKGTGEKVADVLLEIASLPKSAMSTGEWSYRLRQGFLPLVLFTKAGMKGFTGIVKGMASETTRLVYEEKLRSEPRFRESQVFGVEYGQVSDNSVTDEHFTARIFEKGAKYKPENPIGKVAYFPVRQAAKLQQKFEFAYTLPGDVERFYVYDTLAQLVDQNTTLTPQQIREAKKFAAKIANRFTGRGDIRGIFSTNGYFGKFLNALGFSPKFVASRFQSAFWLTPVVSLPFVPKALRPAMAKKQLRWVSTMTSIAALAAFALFDTDDDDWTEIFDPASKKFMRGRIKGTDIPVDLTANMGEPVRLMFANWVGSGYYAATGQWEKFSDIWEQEKERYLVNEQGEPLRFFRGKLSPTASLGIDYLAGKDYLGRDFTWWNAITSRISPLTYQQAYDALLYDPSESLMREPITMERGKERFGRLLKGDVKLGNMAAVFGLAALGAGVQNYAEIDTSRAETKAWDMYESKFESPKSPEQKRVEAGLRKLYRMKDQMQKDGQDVSAVESAIKKYSEKYRIKPSVTDKLQKQATGSRFEFVTQDFTDEQMKVLIDEYANAKEKPELEKLAEANRQRREKLAGKTIYEKVKPFSTDKAVDYYRDNENILTERQKTEFKKLIRDKAETANRRNALTDEEIENIKKVLPDFKPKGGFKKMKSVKSGFDKKKTYNSLNVAP